MTAAPTPPDDVPHWARPLYERQIAVAGQLAEAGLAMALAVKDRTESLTQAVDVEPGVLEGMSRAYGRMARAVRLSLMLQDRLIKELIAFDKKVAHDAAWDHNVRLSDRKDLAGQVIARVIARQHDDSDEAERLTLETAERLDREDLYGAVLSRPVSELVAMICRDLGLDPDWPSLSGEAWAREEAASGVVGWPLRGFPLKPSRLGEGEPAEALAEAGGGGWPGAAADEDVPLPQTLRVRSPSPDGEGPEHSVLASP